MQTTLDLTADIIDVRDIIERIEELEDLRHATPDEDAATWEQSDEAKELIALECILDDLKGYGGDEQWRGDWYPLTLIRDSYFKDYAQELAEDIGAVPANAKWPNNCIDWDQAARELQMDYSATDIGGVTYWYR